MIEKYSNPPLIEALCEFQFIPSSKWNFTVLGRFYEKIKKDFPEAENIMSISAEALAEQGSPSFKIAPFIKFTRLDKTAFVRGGIDLISIHYLTPYSTWKAFKLDILTILEKYKRITNPKGLQRIGLRYINKIDFDGQLMEEPDYFRYYMVIPAELPQNHDVFHVRTEIPYEQGRDRLVMTLSSVPKTDTDKISIMLDFDYIMFVPDAIQLNLVESWLDNSHKVVEDAFESSITEKCRRIFTGDEGDAAVSV